MRHLLFWLYVLWLFSALRASAVAPQSLMSDTDIVHPNKVNVEAWAEANKEKFVPPICNKLLHKQKNLNVMFVGGPNTRTDFHLDEGSEFFFQLKGDIELPTVQQGKRKLVKINEGEVFLLPSRVPHSPQRPNEGSFGLVVERERTEQEMDGLRWYTDFEKCDDILWERFFRCENLGKDLVPVVQAFKASQECASGVPSETSVVKPEDRPIKQDMTTVVPDPFRLSDWLEANRAELDNGAALNLFPGHPDKEFTVEVVGGGAAGTTAELDDIPDERWLYQLEGAATVTNLETNEVTVLDQGDCCILTHNSKCSVARAAGSIGLAVRQNPLGNK